MHQKFYFSKNFYEKHAWSAGSVVCGVDEVGRGCLAGPVVTAAAILYPNSKSSLIKDSKELSETELLKAYSWILQNGWFSLGIQSPQDIDTYNIAGASLRAMRQAVLNLFSTQIQLPSVVLVDAMPLSLKNTAYEHIEVQHFIKGERHSMSIAAASIVAKVNRDRMMRVYDKLFPAFKFASHKGYATKIHQNALLETGYSIIHRRSFLKKFEVKGHTHAEQTSIFCGSD